MNPTALSFLTELLGTEGAKALAKSVQREPLLGHLLVPRAALSWVQLRTDYEGSVPGVQNSYIKFQKSEGGYNGLLAFESGNYEFNDVAPEHLAAAVAVSIGTTLTVPNSLGDLTLQKLGKSIDILVGAQFVAIKLSKSLNATLGYNIREEEIPGGLKVHAFDRKGNHIDSAWFQHDGNTLKTVSLPEDELLADVLTQHAKNHTGKLMAKTDLPAQTAQPRKQQGPIEPVMPTNVQRGIKSQKVKLPKLPAMKVEKSEMERECPACGGIQFKDNKFRGCLCLRDLQKSVRTVIYSDGAVLEFKADFDPEAFKVLRAALKGV